MVVYDTSIKPILDLLIIIIVVSGYFTQRVQLTFVLVHIGYYYGLDF